MATSSKFIWRLSEQAHSSCATRSSECCPVNSSCRRRQPLESINPLKNLCGWDRQVRIRSREVPLTSIFGGFTISLSDNSTKTEVEWYPPGQGLAIKGKCAVSQAGPYNYQVYVREITDFVGTSGVDYDLNAARGIQDSWTYPAGDYVDVIKPPVCPPGEPVTRSLIPKNSSTLGCSAQASRALIAVVMRMMI